MELAGHQQPPRCEFSSGGVGSSPRARADLRLDRNVHLGHRVLFHSQVAAHESVQAADCVGMLGPLGRGCQPALARYGLSVAMEDAAARLGGTRTHCLFVLLPCGFRPSATGRWPSEAGTLGDRSDGGLFRPAGYADCELRWGIIPRLSRRFTGPSASIRPAIPGTRDMGIPGSVRLGIQRQVAAGFPWDCAPYAGACCCLRSR